MLSSSSFGSFILRDKKDVREGQPMLKASRSVKTVECRGVPVPDSHHHAVLDDVSSPQKDEAHKLPIIEELERKNCQRLPYLFEGGIDLRPLTSVLSPASEVFEADLQWDFDSLTEELAALEVKLNNDASASINTAEDLYKRDH